jgi:hypothetical protein
MQLHVVDNTRLSPRGDGPPDVPQRHTGRRRQPPSQKAAACTGSPRAIAPERITLA